MTVTAFSLVKSVRAGALAGLTTSILTGILGVLAEQATGQEVFFVAIARDWGFGNSSVAGGWALHLLTGLLVGAIFLGVTSSVPKLGFSTWPRTIGIGAGAGILVWIVLLYPLAAMFVPEVLATTDLVVGTLVGHVIFGGVTATLAVFVMRRAQTPRPVA